LTYLKTFINAILAGIMISIGGTVYLATENKIAGAILFAVGLMTICVYQMSLFTGKIGYIFQNKPAYTLDCLVIWIGNICGTLLAGIAVAFAKPDLSVSAGALVEKKLSQAPFATVILGIFCGILMYVAVDNFRTNKHEIAKYLGIFICVPVFILAGFEHSVADMFYFAVAEGIPLLSAKGFLYIIYVSIGNLLGSWIIPNLKLLGEKLIKS
jgi:formate/nitrite transporter FocA (FNT family)